jgi:hypothetical protein
MAIGEFQNITSVLWRLNFGGIPRKKLFLKFTLCLLLQRITDSTWLAVPVVTQQIRYPHPSEKSLRIWTNCRAPQFCSWSAQAPPGPLSCATGAADSYGSVCDLWFLGPAAVTLLGSWLNTALVSLRVSCQTYKRRFRILRRPTGSAVYLP